MHSDPPISEQEARFRRVFRRLHAGHPACLADEWLTEPCRDERGAAMRPIAWSRRNGPWRRSELLWVGAAPGNAGGRGAGDLGAHIIDHPVWALGLGAPSVVESRVTLDGTILEDGKRNLESFPLAAIIYFEFPAPQGGTPIRLTWYEGGLMPPTPPEMAHAKGWRRLHDNGVLYVGTKGMMHHSSHGGMPQLLPSELHDEAAKVPKTMERSPGHYEEWLLACKGGPKPVSNFDYAGPLTEILLLGLLACRSPGRRLEWDSANLKKAGVDQYSVQQSITANLEIQQTSRKASPEARRDITDRAAEFRE